MWLLYWGVSLRQFGLERPLSPVARQFAKERLPLREWRGVGVAHGVRGHHIVTSPTGPILSGPALFATLLSLSGVAQVGRSYIALQLPQTCLCCFPSGKMVLPLLSHRQTVHDFLSLLPAPSRRALSMSPFSPKDELPEVQNIFASISTMNCEYDEVTSSSVHLQDSPRVT